MQGKRKKLLYNKAEHSKPLEKKTRLFHGILIVFNFVIEPLNKI